MATNKVTAIVLVLAFCTVVCQLHLVTGLPPLKELSNANMEEGPQISDFYFSAESIDSEEEVARSGRSLILQLSASKIPPKDTFNNDADAFLIVYSKSRIDGKYRKFAETKPAYNNANPTWNEYVVFKDYEPGTGQKLKFDVIDYDGLSSNDFIGSAYLEIDLCLKSGTSCSSDIPISNNGGSLHVKLIYGLK